MRPFARVLSMIAMLVLTMQPAGASFRAERPDADPGFMTVQRSRSGGGGGFRSYSPPPRSYTPPPAPRTFAPAPRTFAPAPSRPQVFQTPSRPMPYMGQRPGGFAQPRPAFTPPQFAQPRFQLARPSLPPAMARPSTGQSFMRPGLQNRPVALPRIALSQPTAAAGRGMAINPARPSVAARSVLMVGGAAGLAAWTSSKGRASTSAGQTGAEAGCTRMGTNDTEAGVQVASLESSVKTDAAPDDYGYGPILLATLCNGVGSTKSNAPAPPVRAAFATSASPPARPAPLPRASIHVGSWSASNVTGQAQKRTQTVREQYDAIKKSVTAPDSRTSRDWAANLKARDYLRQAHDFSLTARSDLRNHSKVTGDVTMIGNPRTLEVAQFGKDNGLVSYRKVTGPEFDSLNLRPAPPIAAPRPAQTPTFLP